MRKLERRIEVEEQKVLVTSMQQVFIIFLDATPYETLLHLIIINNLYKYLFIATVLQ